MAKETRGRGRPRKDSVPITSDIPSQSLATQWENRIQRHEMVAPDQLLANPRNWRVHTQMQQEQMQAILNEIGWINEVIVNMNTGHMIDGHMRVVIAMRENEPVVPVKYVDLTEEEEITALLTYDPITAMAVADRSQLKMALDEVQVRQQPIRDALTDLARRERLLAAQAPPLTHPASPSEHEGEVSVTPNAANVQTQDPNSTPSVSPPSSHVRQVLLFFSDETHPEFLRLATDLQGHFGTDNLTDTVLEICRYAHNTLTTVASA